MSASPKHAGEEPVISSWPCRVVLLALLLSGLAGCATSAARDRAPIEWFQAGNLEKADKQLVRQIERDGRDVDVAKLDRAMLQLLSGNPQDSERLLREVRDRFDYLEQSDIRDTAKAMVTDDNRLAYAGEEYERLLIRVFLTLSSMMSDSVDAEAYTLQIGQKQQQIISRYEGETAAGNDETPSFARLAVGPWLRAAVLEQRHTNYDDIKRSRLQVVSWESQFRDGKIDLERARTGRHSEPGHGVLYVVTLVGRGPQKVEVAQEPTQAALLIADRILSQTLNHSLPPTIAPVKVPQVVETANRVTGIQVVVDGQTRGTTAVLADIGRFAAAQHAAEFPQIIARAVVRRVVKKGAIYAMKEQANVNNPLVELAFDAGGVLWEATEHADTRCWQFLPDQIQVLRVELPAGRHRLGLQPMAVHQPTGNQPVAEVTIGDGRNTYLLACFPNERLTGQILSSEPK